MFNNEKKVQQALQFLRNDAKVLLNGLQPDTRPLWGKMTPQHMLEHLIWVLDGSSSLTKVKVSNAPTIRKMRPLIRQFVLSSIRLPKNIKLSKTKTDLLPLKNESFEAAKQHLLRSIDNAIEIFLTAENFSNNHPFAGSFNGKQWIIFHKKHFTHHFSQFGLMQRKLFV